VTYLSICSGIEAATTAWHPLGWKPIAFSEIEPFPCAVLAHHWPDVPNLGDMTKHHDWPTTLQPDLIVGGTPCQAFSVAGLREGLADPRGNLSLTFLSIVAQYKPQWVVWENVPGVLSDKTGAFGAFLGGLGQLGYGFAYRVLDAQFFGVAQRRRRVFVVANLTDWRRAAAVLFESHSLSGDSPPSRSARKGTSTGFETGFDGGNITDLAPTLDTGCHAGPIRNRGVGVIEPIAARMVAFGEYATAATASTCKQRDYKDATDLVITTQYGEIAGTLTARHDSSPCADQGQNVVAFSCKDHGADSGEISPTAVAFERRFVRTSGGQPQEELNPCLRSDANTGDGAPCVAFCADVSPTLGKDSMSPTKSSSGQMVDFAIATNYAVRRLTPTECERLQGFPDDHTLIPFRGKPAADGPRYKAIGNSMAVPVMHWLGKRIQLITQAIYA